MRRCAAKLARLFPTIFLARIEPRPALFSIETMSLPRLDMDVLLPTRASLLKRLARCEDQESWRTFFDLYWRLIYWWALRRGLEDADAQDVVQTTVMAVARAFRENKFHYDPAVCSFKTWLRRVTDHRITDELRRQRRRGGLPVPLPDADLDETPEPLMAQADSALESAWDEEWERNLLAAAAERVKPRVNPRHFQIFEYHVLQCHAVRETARHLDTNVAQVYLVKHRVAPLMRKEVKRLRDRPL